MSNLITVKIPLASILEDIATKKVASCRGINFVATKRGFRLDQANASMQVMAHLGEVHVEIDQEAWKGNIVKSLPTDRVLAPQTPLVRKKDNIVGKMIANAANSSAKKDEPTLDELIGENQAASAAHVAAIQVRNGKLTTVLKEHNTPVAPEPANISLPPSPTLTPVEELTPDQIRIKELEAIIAKLNTKFTIDPTKTTVNDIITGKNISRPSTPQRRTPTPPPSPRARALLAKHMANPIFPDLGKYPMLTPPPSPPPIPYATRPYALVVKDNLPPAVPNTRPQQGAPISSFQHLIPLVQKARNQNSRLASVQCRFYAQGRCRNGLNCRFAHTGEVTITARAPKEPTFKLGESRANKKTQLFIEEFIASKRGLSPQKKIDLSWVSHPRSFTEWCLAMWNSVNGHDLTRPFNRTLFLAAIKAALPQGSRVREILTKANLLMGYFKMTTSEVVKKIFSTQPVHSLADFANVNIPLAVNLKHGLFFVPYQYTDPPPFIL
uniref:Protein 1 n=1 Tax=Yado-nushi virus 1-B TaxID=2094185 RepID=A0A2Z5PT76_9VIRU|nr:protein 1 [Yado-nushi virus 1-B]